MSRGIYYTAPDEASFEDMKRRATEIWNSYDDTYGYATKRTERIDHIKNVGDNFMYIFAMFDMSNQRKIVSQIRPDTRKDLRDRMIDGGNSNEFLILLGLDEHTN